MSTDASDSTLPNETVIWHYRDLASFLSILQTESLWFSRLDQLRDPFEGRSEHPYKSQFMQLAEQATRRQGFVNCWTIDDEESELMWFAYAPNFGVAIKSTVGDLRLALPEESRPAKIKRVQYGTDWASGPPESYAFQKRRHFKREQELRVLVEGKVAEKDLAGMAVPVVLSTLLNEVWISPLAPAWLVQVVAYEMKGHRHGNVRVRRREDSLLSDRMVSEYELP